MDHSIVFLQDLAVVMIVAGLVTLLFHRLGQPVVVGYMLAGLIIGPYTPPYPLVKDIETIKTMAELGMIFLMFRMGLHFSLRKLFSIGAAAILAALFEISLMIFLGYEIGLLFGWSKLDSMFLGAMLSISSTTIIVRTLTDLKLLEEKFVGIIFGILIGEDLLAIGIIALLPTLAISGTVPVMEVMQVVFQLAIFLAVTLVGGLLLIPRLLNYVARYREAEMLLITSLALCFGVALVANKLGYSVALGAFLVGAIIAETRQAGQIEHLIAPLRNMFSAVFFVAIGMLIQPQLLTSYAGPIVAITMIVIFGKFITCSSGALLAGNDLHTSMRVGMGLAQIGEFSFIIAQIGLSLGLISDFLYPIIVTVSALTAISTPYLVKNSDNLANQLTRITPSAVLNSAKIYHEWVNQLRTARPSTDQQIEIKRLTFQLLLNLLFVGGIFVLAIALEHKVDTQFEGWGNALGGTRGLFWFMAMIISLPFSIACYRKMNQLTSLLSSNLLAGRVESSSYRVSQFINYVLSFVGALLLSSIILALSLALLPPLSVMLMMLVVIVAIGLLMRKSLAQLYNNARSALTATLSQSHLADHTNDDKLRSLLSEASLGKVEIAKKSIAANKLIRELHLRSQTGASIVGIQRGSENIVNPGPDEELQTGNTVLLIGTLTQVEEAKLYLTSDSESAESKA